jgi:hypothetical protein
VRNSTSDVSRSCRRSDSDVGSGRDLRTARIRFVSTIATNWLTHNALMSVDARCPIRYGSNAANTATALDRAGHSGTVV